MKTRTPWPLVLALLAPTVCLLAVFNYVPALIGLQRAFTHWESGEEPKWSGLDNFAQLAHDEFLWLGVGNLVLLLLANLVKTLTMPLLVAELLVALKSPRWQWLLRTLFTLPMVVPGMVTMLLWAFLYDGSVGAINAGLEAIGLGSLRRAWLGEAGTALGAVAGVGFPWCGGLALLVYLAGLANISTDLNDAAALDGATNARRVFAIDLPLLRPQVRLLATLTCIGTLQDFGSILILTGGGPGLATHVPALHMYFQAFRFGHLGYAAALGLTLFLVIFVLSLASQRLGRTAEDGA